MPRSSRTSVASADTPRTGEAGPEEPAQQDVPIPPVNEAQEPFVDRLWAAVVSRTNRNVTDVVGDELRRLRTEHGLDRHCVIALYEPKDRIVPWYADRLVSSLQATNLDKGRDVVLLLRNRGGQIGPAYQMAKAIKSYSATKFLVVVPRAAKSAATLLALGADEIHLGILGELGPIDPQIDDLPALGVKRALETLAALAEQTPGSSEMFANYLARTVRIDQIGYYERVAESAVQYAERLIRTKPHLAERATEIAKQLVYEYKDHGFVIDAERKLPRPADT